MVEGTPAEGWPLWMEEAIEWAEVVLVVCTDTYLRRVKKRELKGGGLGATWEAHLIYQHLYEEPLFNAKFIPLIFDGSDEKFIPLPLRGCGFHRLDEQKGYDALYVFLTGQHKRTPDIGEVREVPREPAAALFGDPGGAAGAPFTVLTACDLKAPTAEPYPEEPYPLLLPYKHPDFFAGRERDLAELMRRLDRPVPILGLFSASGTGKLRRSGPDRECRPGRWFRCSDRGFPSCCRDRWNRWRTRRRCQTEPTPRPNRGCRGIRRPRREELKWLASQDLPDPFLRRLRDQATQQANPADGPSARR